MDKSLGLSAFILQAGGPSLVEVPGIPVLRGLDIRGPIRDSLQQHPVGRPRGDRTQRLFFRPQAGAGSIWQHHIFEHEDDETMRPYTIHPYIDDTRGGIARETGGGLPGLRAPTCRGRSPAEAVDTPGFPLDTLGLAAYQFVGAFNVSAAGRAAAAGGYAPSIRFSAFHWRRAASSGPRN